MSKRKTVLHEVMEQLDKEVEEGNLNEGAHLRLCKRLKTAFDEAPTRRKHIKSYLLDTLLDDPIAALSVPVKYRSILDCPKFLTALFDAKRKESDPISEVWWADLLEGLVPAWVFDHLDDNDFLCNVRGVVGILLATDDDTLVPLEKHLDKHKITPTKLFALEPTQGYAEFWPNVSHVLGADARFIRWLLADDGYSEAEKKQLREYAFDHSEHSAHTDEGWRAAMGFGDMIQVVSCVTNRALGKSFEEARAMALAKYANEPSVEG